MRKAKYYSVTGCLMGMLIMGQVIAGEPSAPRQLLVDDLLSVAVPSNVKVSSRPNLPEDFVVYDFTFEGTVILGLYAGNAPRMKDLKTPDVRTEQIGEMAALTTQQSVGDARTRDSLVHFPDPVRGWPQYLHFFYRGLTPDQARIADAIIASARREPAGSDRPATAR